MLKVANSVISASRITGVLPVVNGGTGVTTSTGTGNTVLSATPTLSGDVSLSTGNLVIGTSGKGIDFTADPSAAGMTSELFADYEEGTWTPITSASVTPPTTPKSGSGTYTKIGRQVTVTCDVLDGINMSGSSGFFQVTNLPFTNANLTGNAAMGNCILFKIDTPAGTVNLAPYLEKNSTTLLFYATIDNLAYQFLTDNATTDGRCWFTITYFS